MFLTQIQTADFKTFLTHEIKINALFKNRSGFFFEDVLRVILLDQARGFKEMNAFVHCDYFENWK